MSQLTVKELIAELQKFPEDAKVRTEGCDCYGDAASVEWFDEAKSQVLITR